MYACILPVRDPYVCFLPAPEGGGGSDDDSVVQALQAADLRNTP